MRKQNLLLTAPVFALFLMGCNTDDDKVTNVPDNAPVEGTTATTQTNQTATNTQSETNQTTNTQNNTVGTTNAAFNFTDFDLDVEYGVNQEYDVDYENDHEGMEAEIKDDKGNNRLRGNEAFEFLKPIFESLTFDQNTPNAEVISEVINAFKLDDNYRTFELEVTFTDGTKKEYKERK